MKKVNIGITDKNREAIADQFKAEGISDYITGLMEYHEKTAWMLRSHLS